MYYEKEGLTEWEKINGNEGHTNALKWKLNYRFNFEIAIMMIIAQESLVTQFSNTEYSSYSYLTKSITASSQRDSLVYRNHKTNCLFSLHIKVQRLKELQGKF